jgi:hypothetical protein
MTSFSIVLTPNLKSILSFRGPASSLISPFWGLNRISVIFAKLNERVPDLRDSAPASAQPKALRNVPFIVKLYERDYYLELVLCAHGFCGFCCCASVVVPLSAG